MSSLTIGQFCQLACEWEVRARKAGNVCPGREFPELTVADFLKSAAAIAPIMDQAPHQPLGVTILRSIEATRKVVDTNTNLGIILLLAPLASVPLDEPLQPGLSRVLAQTTVEDSRNVYAAIRLAKPGGLGKVDAQDVKDEPSLPLREVMALAQAFDAIALEYVTAFHHSLAAFSRWIVSLSQQHNNIERGILETQLRMLYCLPDSLVFRKMGGEEAEDVKGHALKVHRAGTLETPNGRRALLDFDVWLRSDNHARNPGTTADLIAAALFVALREGLISPAFPFTWHEHPFASGA